jgi:penicillin-binding protein-related factor A (putative recombinase)
MAATPITLLALSIIALSPHFVNSAQMWYNIAMGKKLPFEKEIGDMAKDVFPFVYHAIDVMGPRFTEKKPADYFCCDNAGTFVIVEAKALRGDRLPFSDIPQHQRDALDTVQGAGGYSFLAINFRDAKGPGRAWLIPWYIWLDFEDEWPKKSVNKIEMPNIFRHFELERVTGGWRVNAVDRRLQIWIRA